jgi:outer membrane protein
VKSHPRITTAQLRALIAQEGVRQSRAGRLPFLAANATAVESGEQITRIGAGSLSNSQIFDHTGVGATLSLLVTDFGRTAALTEAAQKRAHAAEADALATRAQLLLQVDAAYLDVLKAEAVKTVAAKTLGMRQAMFTRTDALARNQIKSELDVRFARVSVDDARLLADAAEKDVQAAWAALTNLIGDDNPLEPRPLEMPPAPADLPPDFAPLTGLALAQRPEFARYRAEAEAAKATARAARDARLPTLSVLAAAGYIPTNDSHFEHRYAAGGVNLNVPLFAGGLYRSRQHEAELQASVADATLRELTHAITRDVRLAWLEAVHARERIGLTASLLENATAAQTLAKARFDQGMSSTVELTQADLAQTSAEIAHATAEFTYRVRRDMLDYQTGALR